MFKLLQPVDVVTRPTQLLLTITPNNSCSMYTQEIKLLNLLRSITKGFIISTY